MSRFLLATADDDLESRVRAALGTPNGALSRVSTELTQLGPAQIVAALTDRPDAVPAVIAVGPGLDPTLTFKLARELEARRPDVSVVLLAEPTTELLTQALRAGVRDVIAPDASDEQLRAALQEAAEAADRRRASLQGDDAGARTRVISVVAPKGGSGKTTVAVNLAVSLARRHPGEVLLVDADFAFGDVASALRLVPEHTAVDVAGALPGGDAMAAKVLLTAHDSGLYVLPAPDEPADGERVTPAQTGAMLALLAPEFRYVVVDTAAGMSDHTLAALDHTTDGVLIATMDVASVRSLRKVVAAFDQLELAQARTFVLNRAETRVGLDAEDIAHTVGLPVDVAIPSSRAVPTAMNQGEPLVLADPKSAVSRAVERLADTFAPHVKSERGWLRRRAA